MKRESLHNGLCTFVSLAVKAYLAQHKKKERPQHHSAIVSRSICSRVCKKHMGLLLNIEQDLSTAISIHLIGCNA